MSLASIMLCCPEEVPELPPANKKLIMFSVLSNSVLGSLCKRKMAFLA